jgi:sialate O-acetylesterase
MNCRVIRRLAVGLFYSLGMWTSQSARANVRLPAVFSDHAVLQSGKPIAIWGWGSAGEIVHVEIAGVAADTHAGTDGKWSVALAPIAAGGPYTLGIHGQNAIRINDVLIGEVWLCSGQSNMVFPIHGPYGDVDDLKKVVADGDDPTLRLFQYNDPIMGGRPAVPPNEPQVDRPGKWIVCTPKSVESFSAISYFFARRIQARLHTPMGLLSASVGGTPIEAWTSLSAQRAVPELQPMLGDWQSRLVGYDPVAARAEAVAAKAKWVAERDAAVAAKKSPPPLPPQATYRNLEVNAPAGLFNGLISPLVGYTIRGAIWYQGEANSGSRFRQLYGRQLQTLIADWRKRWGDNFYFSYVQLPGLEDVQKIPSDDGGWGVWIRDGQRQTLAFAGNTSMAITIDLNVVRNLLHPKNKDDFAERLATLALHDVYHQDSGIPTGPLYKQVRWDAGRMAVSFHFDDGLTAKGDPIKPKGFAIAGEDRKFVWANAEIHGNEVVVWSDQIAHPLAVRYDWAANPIGDLENQAHLPCSPFRTDEWPAAATTRPGSE